MLSISTSRDSVIVNTKCVVPTYEDYRTYKNFYKIINHSFDQKYFFLLRDPYFKSDYANIENIPVMNVPN